MLGWLSPCRIGFDGTAVVPVFFLPFLLHLVFLSPHGKSAMSLLIKAILGAVIVVLIGILAKTRHYYIAGLIPLFPTFALIAHYIVGTERGTEALRATILFGIWSIIPYLIYLISLYYFTASMKLPLALLSAVACWSASAFILIKVWAHFYPQ